MVASHRHSLISAIALLTVASLGPACGQITNGSTNDVSSDSMSSGAVGSDGQVGGSQPTGGSGGGPSAGGSGGGRPIEGSSGASGQCVFQVGEVQPCPDICTALLQAQCEEPSPHELSDIEYCSLGLQTVRVSWSDESGGLSCYYRQGDWVGTYQYAHTPVFCDGTSTEIQYGDLLPDCPAPDFQVCAGASGGSGDSDGATGEGGAPPDVPRASCYSDFSGTCGPCCPAPSPDCSDKPDGYPGYSCFSGFCSCSCFGGEWSCGC